MTRGSSGEHFFMPRMRRSQAAPRLTRALAEANMSLRQNLRIPLREWTQGAERVWAGGLAAKVPGAGSEGPVPWPLTVGASVGKDKDPGSARARRDRPVTSTGRVRQGGSD